MKPVRFLAAFVASVLAATLAGAAPAQAVPPPDHNCLSPDGTNLNQLYEVGERIIGPPACREAFAGERWVRTGATWATAPSAADAVYPEGYTPSEPNPIDDFNAKFAGARFVHDAGTPQERSFTFGREALRTGFTAPNGLPYSAIVSPALRPLSVGRHTSTMYLRLSAEHCDGLGTSPDDNCLPEGEFTWSHATFEVFPRSPG